MRAGVGMTGDQRYPLVLAQAFDSCAHYCIIYAAVYSVGPAKRGVDDAALIIDGERETPVVHAGAVLPTVAFPCLVAGLARSRHRMKLPHSRAGARIVTACVSGLAYRRGFACIRADQEQEHPG